MNCFKEESGSFHCVCIAIVLIFMAFSFMVNVYFFTRKFGASSFK